LAEKIRNAAVVLAFFAFAVGCLGLYKNLFFGKAIDPFHIVMWATISFIALAALPWFMNTLDETTLALSRFIDGYAATRETNGFLSATVEVFDKMGSAWLHNLQNKNFFTVITDAIPA